MVLYSNWYKLFWHYTPLDTTIYYVTIFLLIQQATMSPNSHWYCKLLCYYTIIDTWYSNLAYYHTTIDSASLPINLRYLDTKLNPLLYYNWYSNLNEMILLIQQSTILIYMTRYNYHYVMTLDTTTNILIYHLTSILMP